MKTGKGKGMGYHGGKAHSGKVHKHESDDPSRVQTRTESSKSMGIHYSPPGMQEGTVDCNTGKK